ncbi:unnamed protein product [Closterium sp. NIES-53]
MASLRVLAFDPEGCPIQIDTWLDDLQLYLLSDSRDSVSLFDHTSGAAPAPPTTADIEDLVSHLHTSDARYRAAAPAEFLDKNQPPTFITLYFIVTRLLDSLRSVRDHFLSLDPTVLTIDLLEQHLLAAETSVVAVGAARGTPRTPFFEGCSPSSLAPSYATPAAVDVPGAEDARAASASAKCRSSKGKGGKGGGGATVEVVEAVEVVAAVGVVVGVGSLVAAVEAAVGVAVVAAVGVVVVGQELSLERGASGGSGSCPYVIRTGDRAGQTCGKPHTQHRCFSRLDNAWRAEFGDEVERPCWAELLRSGLDPGIETADLGASESFLPDTVPPEALHTFTLDSGASRRVFRDSTTLTPLPAPILVRLADCFGGPVVARSSTVLPCPAVPSGSLSGLDLPLFSTNLVSTAALQDSKVTTTTLGGQRVSICTCTRRGRHLATFTRRPGLSLYTLANEPPQVAASAQVSASGQVAPPCSCRLPTHQTLLWHHRLGHPSLPRLRGMHSRLLRAAPHSSFPPMTAPLQTLHMDVWGPTRVSGQGRERYFLLVVDDCTRYTTVFPLRSKGEVPDVLIPWIRAVCLQLGERFGQDLLILRLHSDRGGEISSDLLREFCRGEGITQSFTLPASLQQNGIAERHIGLVMEVARTSMIHAAAPNFLWSFAVRTSGMGLMLGGRGPVVFTGPADASWVDDLATFSCEAEIYAETMAAQELHWLTFLLTDLGEQPRSPPALYVDNKAMIALCLEYRLEHRTKHITLRYFLARDLQQRAQLRLAYMAIRANTTDIFTKALPPGDHQLFSIVLGLVPTLPHFLTP